MHHSKHGKGKPERVAKVTVRFAAIALGIICSLPASKANACEGYKACIDAGQQANVASNYLDAIRFYKRAAELNKKHNNRLNFMLGRLLFETSQFGEAADYFRQYEHGAKNLDAAQMAVAWRAWSHLRAGEVALALKILREITAKNAGSKWTEQKEAELLRVESLIKEELRQLPEVAKWRDANNSMGLMTNDVLAAESSLNLAIILANVIEDKQLTEKLMALRSTLDEAKLSQGTTREAITRALTERAKFVFVGEPVTLDFPMLFIKNSTQLEPSSQQFVRALGGALAGDEFKNKRVHLIGHADSDGSESYNLQLSRQRAEAIKVALLSQEPALASVEIHTFGKGEKAPKYEGQSEAIKRLNRRLEIEVY